MDGSDLMFQLSNQMVKVGQPLRQRLVIHLQLNYNPPMSLVYCTYSRIAICIIVINHLVQASTLLTQSSLG